MKAKKRLAETIEELQALRNQNAMLKTPPLAIASSTAGNSLFARTDELRATLAKIRAIEAANPALAKYPAQSFPTGNLCNKKDLITAQKHLASIAHKSPAKASTARPAPTTAKAITAPTATAKGRSAEHFLALDPQDQKAVIHKAMAIAAKPLRDELRAAFKSAPAGLRTKFAATFRNALHAHERDQAPSITKAQFDQLNSQQKMDSAKAGIRITN
jgi:hypothetical protein